MLLTAYICRLRKVWTQTYNQNFAVEELEIFSRAKVYIEPASHLLLPLTIYEISSLLKTICSIKCCIWKVSYLFLFLENLDRKSEESQKEMKILLDVYKGAAKDLRDKVEVKIRWVNGDKF